MIRKLDIQQLLSLEKKNVIIFNVGGQIITNQRTTFTQVSKLDFRYYCFTIENKHPSIIKLMYLLMYDPKLFQHLINSITKRIISRISLLGNYHPIEKKFLSKSMLH